jgi:glycosyltransferase involved in cell wall biosynthesis
MNETSAVKLSVAIITYNEEKNIARCIQSVEDIADEIVVVDSFSTDKTKEICKSKGVKFVEHAFAGHIQQKNYALTQTTYNHVLSLDADEELSEELKNNIIEVKKKWEYDAYYFNRLTNYCGQWIRHGSWYPDRKLRLWDKTKGEWSGLNPHDIFKLHKGCKKKHLKGELKHYSFYSISDHLEKMNRYTDISAIAAYQAGRRSNIFRILVNPVWKFVRDYYIKLGLLDGYYGYVICKNTSHEKFLKYAKLKDLYSLIKQKGLSGLDANDNNSLEGQFSVYLKRLRSNGVRKSIILFNSEVNWGGGEKWYADVANLLAENNFEVYLFCGKKGRLANENHNKEIKIFEVSISNLSFLNPFKWIKLYRLFKRTKSDRIIMNLPSDLKIAGPLARILNFKQIIYRRGSAIPIKNKFINRYLFKNVLTNVIANSEATKNTILQNNPSLIDPRKISVIYNGIHVSDKNGEITEPIYTRKNGEKIIGIASRMVYQKGYDYLIDVALQLQLKEPNFKVLVAGTGPLEDEIKSLVAKKKLSEHFVFLGFVTDINAFMNSIDVFVLPSRWEGFGYVIAEAMLALKPVVAFNISSNPELISDSENGFLCEAYNTEEFADKLHYLLQRPKKIKEMGQNGFRMVKQKFSFDQVVEQFQQIIS